MNMLWVDLYLSAWIRIADGASLFALAGADKRGTRHGYDSEKPTTCNAEIRRSCGSREEAIGYLKSRGFLLLPGGWANGRWAAAVERGSGNTFIVRIWLRANNAA